jgi:hypothetical protein
VEHQPPIFLQLLLLINIIHSVVEVNLELHQLQLAEEI